VDTGLARRVQGLHGRAGASPPSSSRGSAAPPPSPPPRRCRWPRPTVFRPPPPPALRPAVLPTRRRAPQARRGGPARSTGRGVRAPARSGGAAVSGGWIDALAVLSATHSAEFEAASDSVCVPCRATAVPHPFLRVRLRDAAEGVPLLLALSGCGQDHRVAAGLYGFPAHREEEVRGVLALNGIRAGVVPSECYASNSATRDCSTNCARRCSRGRPRSGRPTRGSPPPGRSPWAAEGRRTAPRPAARGPPYRSAARRSIRLRAAPDAPPSRPGAVTPPWLSRRSATDPGRCPMRRLSVPDADLRVRGPSVRRAASSGPPPRGAHGRIAAALGALRRWWAAGRHYRPERRYMRGGR
jgi:hypothetical protein